MTQVRTADDFDRDIWCLLGLVFDAVDLDFSRDAIYFAASTKTPFFISTPNLNFTIAALGDPEFRDTVVNSDLSLIDGMPLLWISRLLGTRLMSKSSGSDLFDKLWQTEVCEERKMWIFFFGGKDGVAELACQKINNSGSGLVCAGYLNPGFKSIDDISGQEIIEQINKVNADFLVVALGAKKGQAWINQNRQRLKVPVVSHLGAVVNFVAGNIDRAPVWMQKAGLEWIWRILQEPSLWSRYFSDGIGLLKLFGTRILPYACWRMLHIKQMSDLQPLILSVDEHKEQIVVRIKGDCLFQTLSPLREVFREISTKGRCVKLDLSETLLIDGAFIGLCMMLLKHLKITGSTLTISGLDPGLRRIFRWNCAEHLL